MKMPSKKELLELSAELKRGAAVNQEDFKYAAEDGKISKVSDNYAAILLSTLCSIELTRLYNELYGKEKIKNIVVGSICGFSSIFLITKLLKLLK